MISAKTAPIRSVRVAAMCLALCIGCAFADTTIDPSHQYAYGANVGWINMRGDVTEGAMIGQYYCTGYVWSANCGWICMGNGPTNGWQYGNASAGDFGVNHDGQGRLTGRAYGQNIGWVTFEQTHGRPRVDLHSGILSGSAYGANVGWIGFSNAHAYVRSDTLDAGPDSDLDDLADAYEYRHTNELTALSGLGGHDADGDGASDLHEAGADTDPLDGNDFLAIVTFEEDGSTNRVAWTTRPTRLYMLEETNMLSNAGGWTDVGAGMLGPTTVSPMTQTVTDVTSTTQFYRVRAIVPLSP